MNLLSSRMALVGLFFVFIFISGFYLSRAGKPYSTLILTFHKLLGLASGALLVINAYRIHKIEPLNALPIAAILLTVTLFAALIATGGLLSANQSFPAVTSKIHKVSPFLAVISTGVTIYLLT